MSYSNPRLKFIVANVAMPLPTAAVDLAMLGILLQYQLAAATWMEQLDGGAVQLR